jgi:GT2 family glycosyltransferase
MSAPDVSVLIVHTFEHRLIRQTLRGLRRAAPRLHLEVLVIDNNPAAGVGGMLKREFPEARYFPKDKNKGFGSAMNVGIRAAKGKYVLIFNPDIIVAPEALEKLFAYMEANPEVGIVGPKLLNADGSLQYSCNRFCAGRRLAGYRGVSGSSTGSS